LKKHPTAHQDERTLAQNAADKLVAPDGAGIRRTFVHGLEIVASVGVYRHEQHYEQRVVISLDLDVLNRYDGISDRLSDVYNYEDAIRAARVTAASGHFNLIETLAERIAEACLQNADVKRVAIRIEKPDIVDHCRAVGIEVVRSR
jgi:dihydroneopterin aldolase